MKILLIKIGNFSKPSTVQIYLAILILACITISEAEAQKADWQPLQREVEVKYEDSVVRANVLLINEKPDVSSNLTYYWFGQNMINHNMGGYSGQLLHGEYSVFDKNNNLITKGTFEKGLKQGIWKSWDHEGIIKISMVYNHGLLDGELIIFDESGAMIETKKYKDGQLVIKEDKPFFSFLKKKPEVNDSIQSDTTAIPVQIPNE